MKRILLTVALLAPAIASAQIYPLEVYATVKRDNGQPMKFLRSQSNLTYVGICKGTGENMLCDLAKNGTYTTDTGLTFKVKDQQLFSTNGSHCDYDTDAASLACN